MTPSLKCWLKQAVEALKLWFLRFSVRFYLLLSNFVCVVFLCGGKRRCLTVI
jgi:hypothetical protein